MITKAMYAEENVASSGDRLGRIISKVVRLERLLFFASTDSSTSLGDR